MLLYDRDRFVKQALWIFCVCWICQTVNSGYDTRLCSVGLSNVLYYAFIISGLARMFNPADKTTCHLRPISLWRASSNTGSPSTPPEYPATPPCTCPYIPLHPYPLSPQEPHQQLSGLHRTPILLFRFRISVCVSTMKHSCIENMSNVSSMDFYQTPLYIYWSLVIRGPNRISS